jgi:NADH:quinone reductase (non-electrogenic)
VQRPPHVLVLGGGLAALQLCRALRKPLKRGELTATVVSRSNYFALHGLIAEMVTGRISPGNVLNPARRVFVPAQVHVGEIESIDLEAKRVVTSRHLDGARFELDYDHAVFSFGSADNLDAYPGLSEHAFHLKQFDDSFRLRNHVIEMLELADIESDPEERARLLTFFIAGGGFSGTELAGELSDFVRRLVSREYPGIAREECRVVIVHPGKTLLPELWGSGNAERRTKSYPSLVEYGMRHMRKLGVELMLETRVVGATPNEVALSNGLHIQTRTLISAVGSKPNPLVESLPLARDERGRIVVDEYLRVEGREDLWAGGDCAAVPHPHGGTCPPVALFARLHGTHIGRNLRRVVAGRPLRPYRSNVIGQGISIGRRTAVGELKGIPMRGKLGWLAWRAVILKVIPSADRRLRVLADWMIWPLVGRDVVQMGPSQTAAYDVRHHVYQAGETISDLGRPVRLVHVIVEGEVDLVRGAEGEDFLDTIGPGDHFGRKLLQHRGAQSARARSLVRTLTLREDQANQLQDVLLSTSRIVARTGMTRTIDVEELRRARDR